MNHYHICFLTPLNLLRVFHAENAWKLGVLEKLADLREAAR